MMHLFKRGCNPSNSIARSYKYNNYKIHLNIFSPVGVLECIVTILIRAVRRIDISNHDEITIAFERALQQMCELRIAVFHIHQLVTLAAATATIVVCILSQSIDAVRKCQKGFVDVGAFLKSRSAIVRRRSPLYSIC